jgi:hypothetical protein
MKCALSGAMPHRPGGPGCSGRAPRLAMQPPIAGAVEPDAVQLQLQRVVAVARGVEEDAGRLVDLHQLVRFERG